LLCPEKKCKKMISCIKNKKEDTRRKKKHHESNQNIATKVRFCSRARPDGRKANKQN
jgi:hypothetical protein